MLEDTSPKSIPTSLPRSPSQKIIRREEAQNWVDGYRFIAEGRRAAAELQESAQVAYEEAKARGFDEGRAAGAAEAAAIIAGTVAKVET